MTRLTWWMRTVGGFYLLLGVASSVLRLPIRAEGPAGALNLAATGDAMARFTVDTWFTYGLDFVVIGAALLIASRRPAGARALVFTVIALECFRGIGADVYKLARGYAVSPELVWIAIHTIVIASGLLFLRGGREV